MRIGQPNDDDICLLLSRRIRKLSKNYPWEALHLFYTNKEVFQHNDQMLQRLKTLIHQIEARVEYPGNYKPKITPYGTIDDTNLSQVLDIKVGARSMVVLNVDTSDSLVNGSLGKVLDIISRDDGTVKCIIVKFDSEKAGLKCQEQNPQYAEKYKDENGDLQRRIDQEGCQNVELSSAIKELEVKIRQKED